MNRIPLLLAALIILPGCSAPDDPVRSASDSDWSAALQAIPYDAAKSASPPAPPLPSRDLNDLVPGCNGMNPQQRPRGSNCFGLFPEQCGADLAAAEVGEVMDADRARRLYEASVGDLRVIPYQSAVNDDLRFARLNVHLDEDERIVSVDCY
jgi:hypothetical protein